MPSALVSSAVGEVLFALCSVTQGLPIGTNLALTHFLWMLVSGGLLTSRGALFPALDALGLPEEAVRRCWNAFRSGAWHIADLLGAWKQYVADQGQWQARVYEGYTPKAVDITPFWRPRLEGCPGKHYHAQADKALPAVPLGLIGRVGQIQDQRLVVLTDVVRAEADGAGLQRQLVEQTQRNLESDEMAVFDAGFKVRELQAVGLSRYVVRLASNFTARRNGLPSYSGKGRRPEYGALVRPLPRRYKGKTLSATPADQILTWTDQAMELRAECWYDLVLPDVKVHPEATTFHVTAIYDPRFEHPWLLACPVPLTPASLRGLYQDRWAIEQVPLTGKQLLGGARQFVFAPESCQRLAELALFAGAMLNYLAAALPAVPTGFWDRKPVGTAGRLRRVLARTPLVLALGWVERFPFGERLREKASVVAHLPKGVLGHRRRSGEHLPKQEAGSNQEQHGHQEIQHGHQEIQHGHQETQHGHQEIQHGNQESQTLKKAA